MYRMDGPVASRHAFEGGNGEAAEGSGEQAGQLGDGAGGMDFREVQALR